MAIDFSKSHHGQTKAPLRRPTPPRHSVGAFVAWCALMRALRPQRGFHDGRSTCLAVVIPLGHAFEVYEEAAARLGDYLESRRKGYPANGNLPVYRFIRRTATLAGYKSKIDVSELAKSIMKSRVVLGLAHDAADFMPEFLATADAVLAVESHGERTIRCAGRFVADLDIPDDLAASAVLLPHIDLSLAFRRGRSLYQVRKSLAQLAQRQEKPAASGPTLDDIHGFGLAADWGRQLAQDFSDWKAGALPWSDVDRGLLLSGPPGCGKTTYAKALAATCGVPLVAGSVARWQSMGHLGDLLKAMRACFDEARGKAPCILFLDEVDAFGDRETFSDQHRDYSTQVVAGLLECMDGVEGREGVVVVGAANHPHRLDPAIRRPGRLDRHIEIPLPDARARDGILRFHASGISPDADLSPIVDRTAGWTGADLEQLVRGARRRARNSRRLIDVTDLEAELPAMVPIPEGILRRNAVHEAGHAVATLVLGTGTLEEVVLFRELDPARPVQAGAYTRVRREVIADRSREDYLDDIVTLLAGAAAEEAIFGAVSDGWGGTEASDLYKATMLAATMEASVGLGGGLAYLASRNDALGVLRSSPVLQARVETVLSECMGRARDLVAAHRKGIVDLTDELISRQRLSRIEASDITSLGRIDPVVSTLESPVDPEVQKINC